MGNGKDFVFSEGIYVFVFSELSKDTVVLYVHERRTRIEADIEAV
jgi:hypothetical protein